MKNLEQQFSENLLTQPSNSVRKCSDQIPVDLLIDIFSRVPAKSIARFRCVSKFWESILVRHDFTELFLTKSVSLPRLFFAVEVNKELFVFSSPQNSNDNSSLVATRYKSFPKYFPTRICSPLCGLIFLQSRERKARMICNPATGKSITLPRVKATGLGDNYFGFDPISKQFKVLCMTWSRYGTPNTHRVLTLNTGKRLWRTIQDPLPHHRRYGSEICINGVLYYKSNFFMKESHKIVCFDFRFEKFSFINFDKDMIYGHNYQHLTLFNNKGKLGAYNKCSGWRRDGPVLWVLEDVGKHKWSKNVLVLPEIVNNSYSFVGMVGTGEIVFESFGPSNSFYIFYYNIERKTLTKVDIKGFEEFMEDDYPRIFLDYVESMKFM